MQRLFKTNKSQASIEDPQAHQAHPDPHLHQQQQQPPPGGRQQQLYFDHQHQPYSQQPSQQHSSPPGSRFPGQGQGQDLHSQSQSQPDSGAPPHLGRSQSSRNSSIPDVYGSQRPQVNVVPPLLSQQHDAFTPESPAPIPGQTLFGKSTQVHTIEDKEHKRSKRNIISSLLKDKSKDDLRQREKEKENSSLERKPPGRSSSVHLLRRSHPPSEQPPRESYSTQTSPQSQYPPRQSVYYPPPPTEATDPRASQAVDQTTYEQYQRNQAQFDSPQSQFTHHSVEYTEDAPHFNPQQEQYQAYHQSGSENTSDQYLPYQPQSSRPGNVDSDHYQHLRPPSQTSLGPPSPINTPAQPQTGAPDSRPSTAATNRYSTQSPPQAQQAPQPVMARGDPPNGGIRQQLSQRERGSDEQVQYQSQNQADPRARMSQQQASEQGRNTPPPRSREDITQLDFASLLARHEELQAKYSKVKRYYFEREAQVTQLQNTVANQRLSMSKTSLDDAQYTARFERLSQAINNLSFNIRKNWRAIPPWLRHVCNQDAHTVGTKEMTAVGRACITRWLYESIFQHTFHPGIEPSLSAQLKRIEHNLRRGGQAGAMLTDDQRDDLTTKITTWRLTTIEGLHDMLGSQQAEHYIETMNKHYTHQLTESLKANLTDPPPPGLVEGVGMIVGQAIGIASNIPLESRDICIEYFMPGTPLNETYMKVEPQIVALTNPGPDERILQQQAADAKARAEAQEGDQMSTASADDGARDVEAEIREAAGKAASQTAQQPGQQGRNESVASNASQATIKGSGDKQSKKSGLFGGFGNKKPSMSSRGGDRPEVANINLSRVEGEDERGNVRNSMGVDPVAMVPPSVANEGRIRFAAFVAVEVRGKGPGTAPASSANNGKEPGSAAAGASPQSSVNVLFKAPVYEY
ncbi:hypothetical protein A1O7_02219 [Cladophialophora yegresii CBS 114405]|uniref:Uncharacterized protein n=1 Tax=Cladophialophora yegresii CBS 114405 TaxID=1182544 RepID=W9WTZ5_9EURO|nr:uncharacterized protein A1O7_02219 [Cladophialophora yegresii CBS 114405]EXJ61789.1 hypothetical protein A1O7_02219 [Cladophialophora yegresii CBS 114405]